MLTKGFPYYIIISLSFFIVYVRPIRLIFDNTFAYHYSHGILILGIVFYMIWRERGMLKTIPPCPHIIAGGIVSLFGSAALLTGTLTDTEIIEGVALIIGIAGLVLLLLGKRYLKVLAFPILYLSFAFPLFDKVLAGFSKYFEKMAAQIAAGFLKYFGIPVLMYDNIIELPHINLNVVQACNGINHIIALVALVLFVGYLEQMKYWKIMLLILSAVVVGVIANGLRVGLIGLWTMYYGTESFHGPFDIFYSTFVFLTGLLIIWLLIPIFKKKNNYGTSIKNNTNEIINGSNSIGGRTKEAFAIALSIFISTWFVMAYADPAQKLVEMDMNNMPKTIGSWQGHDVAILGEPYEKMEGLDSVLRRVYRDNQGNSVNLLIGYLHAQNKEKEIHHYPAGKLENDNTQIEVTSTSGNNYRLRISSYEHHGNEREAIYFYYINGNIIDHRYKAKIASMIRSLKTKKSNAAIIVVSYAVNAKILDSDINKSARQFTGELIQMTQKYMTTED